MAAMMTYFYFDCSEIEKPRYRIQWDYCNGEVVGFWLWTCNQSAIDLQPSTYYSLSPGPATW